MQTRRQSRNTAGVSTLSPPPSSPSTSTPGFFGAHPNIFWYVPNLVGYLRVLSAGYAFAVARTDPTSFAIAYLFSFVCDDLDGRLARALGQCSTFGVVLDMVTDRVATTCLLALLGAQTPCLLLPALLLIALDIASHWFQMFATMSQGSKTHKDTSSKSLLVRLYYRHRLLMGACCVSCEVLYVAIFLLQSGVKIAVTPGPFGGPMLATPTLVTLFQKVGINAIQTGRNLPVVALLALLALPGFVLKQFANWKQLETASKTVVLTQVKELGASKRN